SAIRWTTPRACRSFSKTSRPRQGRIRKTRRTEQPSARRKQRLPRTQAAAELRSAWTREGARPHTARPDTCLEAVGYAGANVVVVLTVSAGIDVQVGGSGVEVARFGPKSPAMPDPHIQSRSELDHAGIGAAWPRVRSVEI